ncbi:hypothetical protein [Montanilutibacter psychrotolerans]|uniref:Uncharacterized protein n=1 Tax=Montanilutibacter psychrotolerans TaxID=1327343 RepID=A0A3M8STP2_9GAMM|nr:hypothetical protein [Lysobacter psychrotolerans]RNF84163.1 hypothetical protein EER27_07090 [Lysobacter psychrotolerans]
MHTRFRWAVRLLLSYLLASAALAVFVKWPNLDGNAHVPFSGFPEFLVWSPMVPFLALGDLPQRPVSGLLDLSVFLAVFVTSACLLLRTKKR